LVGVLGGAAATLWIGSEIADDDSNSIWDYLFGHVEEEAEVPEENDGFWCPPPQQPECGGYVLF
jgi:hypothetical protein